MKIIDLTHTIKEDMPMFPNCEPPSLKIDSTYEKDGFKETKLSLLSHTGTHIDAPAHIFKDHNSLDQLSIDQYIGKAIVIDCRNRQKRIIDILKHYENKLNQVDFLLFYFGWDQYWGHDTYFNNYPCLDDEVLEFIIHQKLKGIGVDSASIDPIDDENLHRHKKLFQTKNIIIIENLNHLGLLCNNEIFNFCCFPLKINNADGCPVRAVAWYNELS